MCDNGRHGYTDCLCVNMVITPDGDATRYTSHIAGSLSHIINWRTFLGISSNSCIISQDYSLFVKEVNRDD